MSITKAILMVVSFICLVSALFPLIKAAFGGGIGEDQLVAVIMLLLVGACVGGIAESTGERK